MIDRARAGAAAYAAWLEAGGDGGDEDRRLCAAALAADRLPQP